MRLYIIYFCLFSKVKITSTFNNNHEFYQNKGHYLLKNVVLQAEITFIHFVYYTLKYLIKNDVKSEYLRDSDIIH